MSTYAEAVAAVRSARAARDDARDELYARELRRLELTRARERVRRGDAVRDPAGERALKNLHADRATLRARLRAIEKDLAALDALPSDIADLNRRAATARKDAAVLAERTVKLAGLLDEVRDPSERRRMQEELRAAQSRRAALEEEAETHADATAEKAALLKRADRLRLESGALKSRVRLVEHEIEDLSGDDRDADLDGAARENARAIVEARTTLTRFDRDLRAAIDALLDRRTPQQLIEEWDDSLPILLLPARIETRWKLDAPAPAAPELRVRVYPDDVAITTHEKVLTDAEVTHGRAYWTAFRKATLDATLDDARRADAQALAWTALATRFGANRAAWIARETLPLNRDAAFADPSLELEFPEPPLTKPDGWTAAPHSRVQPDRWVLLAWRADTLRVEQVGRPTDDIVVVGPEPLEDEDDAASIGRADDGTLTLGEPFAWMRDFERAVAAGMAFRVPVTAEDVAQGFDRLVVLGLRSSCDADDARALIEHLLESHRYSEAGLQLLMQGTPTNNTDGGDSGYTEADVDAVTGAAQAAAARFTPVDDRSAARDGQRLADYLGIGYDALEHVPGAEYADHAEAVAMNRAAYAGTLGYYLDHMLNDVVDEGALAALRRHFTDHVTGRGPIAALRVGSQPYGVLPTSALSRWRATTMRRAPGSAPVSAAGVTDPFEQTMLDVLRRLDDAWSTLLPRVAQVTGTGDPATRLLDVLALHPTSAEFHQRVGYSYDYLKNLESFTWGGADFDDVMRMSIEGMNARTLLRQLGYDPSRAGGAPKPHPVLLQLIWRHYHTRLDAKQLIDGRPLSESERVAPYDAAGTRTYLDWLFENAADAEAIEAQDFGSDAARPGFLLYLMLHYSLVMEAGRGIHTWLGERGVNADELVRTRRFMNIGVQPTPSVWEVFRAPANRIVANEPSSRPLLELIYAGQLSGGAGQSVQEQRAAIDVLRALPTARLERALVEHIDTLGYRLDAWQTALFERRLHRTRRMHGAVAERRTGLYVGGFGYLENVRPNPARRRTIPERTLPERIRRTNAELYESTANGGFVHAPSMNHATAAALLRSGYLTHATPNDPDMLAVNLSSARVRRARYLVDGVRNGQSLEVLLGVQFERGLHDWTTRSPDPVILDHLKPALRAAFPIQRTKVPQVADTVAVSVVNEDHQVVNGLTLARTRTAYPYGVAALNGLSAEQKAAIIAEKSTVENTLDALRDVLTAEAAYQLALGNFDRAAAIVQATGNGTIPPDLEVLDTPRGTGIAFTQRVAVHLTATAIASPWIGVPMTERARLEPSLNAWAGTLLGAPDNVRCRVSALAGDSTVLIANGAAVEDTVTLADLRLQPIDFVHTVRSQVEQSGAAELESRIRYVFARRHDVSDDVVVRIAFADAGDAAGARSFAEVLPLADRVRRMLGTARPLDAHHFQSASRDDPAPADNPGRIDMDELRTRVTARLTAVRALFPALQSAADVARTAATAANAEALRAALLAIADAGFTYALPQSAVGAELSRVETLVQQADAILVRAAALAASTAEQLAHLDDDPSASHTVELLTDAVKAWVGADMLLLPRFMFHDAAAVAQADAARDTLLAYARNTVGVPLPVEEWLHGAACVRPLVHDLEMVRVMADAVREEPLPLSAIQLPFRTGDHWLGAQYPPTMEVVHDTISVVQHLPQGFTAAGPQCGLLIDEWTESVPMREEVTGVAFNYDAPNSAPPQALLLAVSPDETGTWSWDDLVETVLDTFRRARLRAIEPDHIGDLPGIGTLLPALIAEFSTSRGSVSLDYSFVFDAVRAPALATMHAIMTGPVG